MFSILTILVPSLMICLLCHVISNYLHRYFAYRADEHKILVPSRCMQHNCVKRFKLLVLLSLKTLGTQTKCLCIRSLQGEWTTDVSTLHCCFRLLWYEVGRYIVKVLQAAAISPYTSPTPVPAHTLTTPGTLYPTHLE